MESILHRTVSDFLIVVIEGTKNKEQNAKNNLLTNLQTYKLTNLIILP